MDMKRRMLCDFVVRWFVKERLPAWSAVVVVLGKPMEVLASADTQDELMEHARAARVRKGLQAHYVVYIETTMNMHVRFGAINTLRDLHQQGRPPFVAMSRQGGDTVRVGDFRWTESDD